MSARKECYISWNVRLSCDVPFDFSDKVDTVDQCWNRFGIT